VRSATSNRLLPVARLVDKAGNCKKSFDAYEIIGVITPGTVVALMLAMEWPAFRSLLGDKGLSVGDVGLFVLVAYVLGHLIQAVGNVVEAIVWFPSGLPTNWVRNADQNLVTAEQRAALGAAVAKMEGAKQDIANINRRHWLAITTRAYGRLRMAGHPYRVDIANRAYGLSRGLAAALLVLLVWLGFANRYDYPVLVILGAAFCASIWRMRRAGIQYARTLVLDFIDMSQPTGSPWTHPRGRTTADAAARRMG
jgi:hypothetical protein